MAPGSKATIIGRDGRFGHLQDTCPEAVLSHLLHQLLKDVTSWSDIRVFRMRGSQLVLQQVNAATMKNGGALFVTAVTQDVSARVDLARQLPGESVLLLFPDHATAAKTLGEVGPSAGPKESDRPAGMITCGELLIDPLGPEVTWSGIPLPLTRLERAVLARLAEPPVRAWSYERLYRAAWGDTWLGDNSAVHAAVKRLRRKLRDAGVTVFPESIRGVGFRLDTGSAATGAD